MDLKQETNPKEVYALMQVYAWHAHACFCAGVFSNKEDAEYACEGTIKRGGHAHVQKVTLDFPRELMFKEWDEKLNDQPVQTL